MNLQNRFILNSVLEKDSILIKELQLCQLRLIRDGELDWFILVPMRNDIKEIFQLSSGDQFTLLGEINLISKLIDDCLSPDKINIAALGNMVSQLHIHVIARFKTDRAWPKTVWGTSSEKQFCEDRATFWRQKM